jgi:hypothetical protein
MTEEQVKGLLDQEMLGERRIKVMERLHQRYNTLRVARERIAMCGLGDAQPGPICPRGLRSNTRT